MAAVCGGSVGGLAGVDQAATHGSQEAEMNAGGAFRRPGDLGEQMALFEHRLI